MQESPSTHSAYGGATTNQSLLHNVCPHCTAINRIPRSKDARQAKCGACHKPLFTGKPANTDAKSFKRHITRNDIPVVVDFWAPWCGPCRAMAPALERAASELEPDFRFLKLNTEEEPAISAEYAIRSIPTLMMFAGGKLVAQIAGAMDTGGIVSWVRAHKPGR
jgi:thioredoxin 2